MATRFGFSGLNAGLNSKSSGITSVLTALGLQGVIIEARVESIVLDETHPRFNELGQWNAIGTIEYSSVTNPNPSDKNLATARPAFGNIKNFPLKNELVFLIGLPNTDIGENTSGKEYYYIVPVNLWNHPHHNGYPADTQNLPPEQAKDFAQIEAGSVRRITDNSSEINLGKTFVEKANIHPLLPFEGDLLVEGRFGNGIRLGSTVVSKETNQGQNNWSEGSLFPGDPITMIRNGQDPSASLEGWIPITENINKDRSSIYLTSTQTIPIQLASPHSVGYTTPPKVQYDKPQIIANADRILLNSKQDSILLSSANLIGLSAQKSINLQSNDSIILYGRRVNLGGTQATQAVLKGDETIEQLKQIVETLNELMKVFEVLAVPLPNQQTVRLQTVNAASKQVRSKLTSILGTLDSVKSKTVFTL